MLKMKRKIFRDKGFHARVKKERRKEEKKKKEKKQERGGLGHRVGCLFFCVACLRKVFFVILLEFEA